MLPNVINICIVFVKSGSGTLEQIINHLKKGYDLCQGLPNPSLFSSICQALAVCYSRHSPNETNFYLNVSSAVALRHQAIYSSGKKLRYVTKMTVKPFFSFKNKSVQVCWTTETGLKLCSNWFFGV